MKALGNPFGLASPEEFIGPKASFELNTFSVGQVDPSLRDHCFNRKTLAELDLRLNHHDCVDRHHKSIAYQRYSSLRPEAVRLVGTMRDQANQCMLFIQQFGLFEFS